ncbi:UNKNOWN [Stylonychia lemnae]|uniref:Uncharacterized protein n=1 Tax=Stylonychia lemnae TaxID=5949 RepID=A0A078B2V9_STYLE|nr:UNKNOWN [Stylonychia lemnae]|eukprot:CDW87843.1 UNKNOWN [Stylonychia lemnae]
MVQARESRNLPRLLRKKIRKFQSSKEKRQIPKNPSSISIFIGMVHQIERDNEEWKLKIQKKEPFFPMNEKEQNALDYLKSPQNTNAFDYQVSHEIQIDKDDFFLQMRQKIDALRNEKRRLIIEIERTVKENLELNRQKNKIIDTTKSIIDDIKASNDNLMDMLSNKQIEVDGLKKDLTDKNIQVTKLKEKVSEYQKLQEKFKMLEHKYVMDINSEKQIHEKEMKFLNREINNKQKYAIVCAQYEEKIKFQEQEMVSYKEKLKSLMGQNAESNKFSEIHDKQAKLIESLTKQCSILTMKLANKKSSILFLRQENQKQFEQLKKLQKSTNGKESAQKLERTNLNREVETNPSLLKQYRKMIEERDIIVIYFLAIYFLQIKEMTKKFKKMNLNDKHLYVKHQQLEHQKEEYEKLIRQHKLKQNNQPINLDESVSDSSLDEYNHSPSIFNKNLHSRKDDNKEDSQEQNQFYTVKSMDSLYKENLPSLGLSQNGKSKFLSPKNSGGPNTMTTGQKMAAQYLSKNGVNQSQLSNKTSQEMRKSSSQFFNTRTAADKKQL